MVGDDEGVAASYLFTAHLAEREVAYTFPNPWRKQNYGVAASPRGAPGDVDWIVLDEELLNPDERGVLDCVLGSGAFTETFREETIVAYRRLHDAGDHDGTCS